MLLSIQREARKILSNDDVEELKKTSCRNRRIENIEKEIEFAEERKQRINKFKKKTYQSYLEEFGKCQKYTEKKQKKISPVEVRGGREKQVKVRQQGAFTYVDTTGADLTKIENKTRKDKNVKAPLKKGEKVGETMYYLNGKRIGSIDIITTEEIEKQNYRNALENVLEEYVL